MSLRGLQDLGEGVNHVGEEVLWQVAEEVRVRFAAELHFGLIVFSPELEQRHLEGEKLLYKLFEYRVAQAKLIGHPEAAEFLDFCLYLLQVFLVRSVSLLLVFELFEYLLELFVLPEDVNKSEMDHFQFHEVEFRYCPVFLREGQRFFEVFGRAERGLARQVNADTRGKVGGIDLLPEVFREIEEGQTEHVHHVEGVETKRVA